MMLKEILLNVLEEEMKKEYGNYQGMLRVSALSQCSVLAVWNFLGLTPKIDKEKLPILAIGLRLHELFPLPLYRIEEEFKRKYRNRIIVGHIDGVFINEETKEKYIVEFKTVSDKIYGKKTTKDYLPSSNHILQTHFYMRLSEIRKAKLVYLLKSSGKIVEFEIPYSEKVEKEMLNVLDTAIGILEGDIDPVDVFIKNKKETKLRCEYCSFSHLCKKALQERVDNDLEYV